MSFDRLDFCIFLFGTQPKSNFGFMPHAKIQNKMQLNGSCSCRQVLIKND